MNWIRKKFGNESPQAGDRKLEAFKLLIEPDAPVVPAATVEEARVFVESLGSFHFKSKDFSVNLPADLPQNVHVFFSEFSSVSTTFAEIYLADKRIYFDIELGLWCIENNSMWTYRLFALPAPDSKLYLHYDEDKPQVCRTEFESIWHYVWGFYLLFEGWDSSAV